jgi:hypothetical protein
MSWHAAVSSTAGQPRSTLKLYQASHQVRKQTCTSVHVRQVQKTGDLDREAAASLPASNPRRTAKANTMGGSASFCSAGIVSSSLFKDGIDTGNLTRAPRPQRTCQNSCKDWERSDA